jgi:plastocyanin
MPLSGTGPIKMSQIKTELGSSSNSLRTYSAAAGKSAPDVMSEFFGYSHTPYVVIPAATTYNEGDTITWTVNTTGIANGTILYWTNSGTTVAADFVENTNSGNITISAGTATISRTIKNDTLTEGSQTIIIQLRTGSISGTIVATATSVTIEDTSKAPTYSVSPSVNSVDEGGTIIWTVTTTDVPNGTTLYWTNSGTAVGVDFVGGTNSGNFTINSNSGTISKTLSSDSSTEGPETIIINIRTVSITGTIVATSTGVTVNDTSTTPPPTYYSFSLGYDAGDPSTACNATPTIYYSLCTNLASGDCELFTSSTGGYAPNGYYSNGTSVYYVEGNGYINTISACPPPPPPPPPPPADVYTEYYNCPDGGMWYIQGQNLPAKINRAGSLDCMEKIQEHATPPGGNQFFSYTAVNCACE